MKRTALFMVTLLMISVFTNAQEAPKGKFAGQVFGDFYYNIARDDSFSSLLNAAAPAGDKDMKGFVLRRVNLGYDYQFNEKFSGRIRIETDNTTGSDDKVVPYLKDAFLTWKEVFKGSDLLIGVQSTPAFEIAEYNWGHRFIERNLLDLRGIQGSRDLGISLKGRIDSEGKFKYMFLYGNGAGLKLETNKEKRYYTYLQWFPIKPFNVAVFFDYKENKDVDNGLGEMVHNNEMYYGILAGWKNEKYSAGLETYVGSEQNGWSKLRETETLKGMGASVFGSYSFNEKWSAVGRFDMFNPNTDGDAKGDSRNLVILGCNYKPVKGVTITPNIYYETYEKLPDPLDFTFDASLTGRLTFFFIF